MHVESIISEIDAILPNKDMVHVSRRRRALIPFIGKIVKGLFDLATTEDVNKYGK